MTRRSADDRAPVHAANFGVYGVRKVWQAAAAAPGIEAGRDQVARLMRALGLPGRHPHQAGPDHHARRRSRSDPPTSSSASSARRRPNRLWVADLTYVWTRAGLRLRGLRRRRLQPAHRRLAGRRPACAPSSPSTRSRWRSAPRGGPTSTASSITATAGVAGRIQPVVATPRAWRWCDGSRQAWMAIRAMRGRRCGRRVGRRWRGARTGAVLGGDRRGLSSEDAAVEAGRVSRRSGRGGSVRLAACRRSQLGPAVGPLPVVRRARGDRDPARAAASGCARSPAGSAASPSTISRELRRNAVDPQRRAEYRATTAQWHAERRARGPKVAKLAANDRAARLRAGPARRARSRGPDGERGAGPGGARGSAAGTVAAQDRRWARSWSPEQISNRLPGRLPR